MIRVGEPPYYECSSRGDKCFGALYARVDGCTIEERYQRAKIFAGGVTGLDWRSAKGRNAVNMQEVLVLYKNLWQ